MRQKIAILIVLLFSVAAREASELLRSYLESQARYWGIQEKISEADMNKLVDLKQKADAQGLNREERTSAYTDLFHFVQKLRGYPETRVPAAMAASYWTEGQPPIPSAGDTAKPGQLANVTKRGTGDIKMILIPDLGADWTVFESFMKRNDSRFTFYATTLPGFGGTAPPARPAKLDFGATAWWKNAESGILDLITKQKLDHPLVLGHQAGAYLAMKLALKHPEHIRGAIVLNGLLYAPLPGVQQKVSLQERAAIVNSWTPVELFPNSTTTQYRTFLSQYAPWFCKDEQRQKNLADLAAKSGPVTWWNYYAELSTTDLSGDIKSLKRPMLVLPSIYDSALPGYETYKTTLAQWNPLEHSVSSLPITVIRMEDCRGYAMEDQPAKMDDAIRNWVTKLPG